jgi:hypothetical protein
MSLRKRHFKSFVKPIGRLPARLEEGGFPLCPVPPCPDDHHRPSDRLGADFTWTQAVFHGTDEPGRPLLP